MSEDTRDRTISRRRFLKLAATAGAAASVGGIAAACRTDQSPGAPPTTKPAAPTAAPAAQPAAQATAAPAKKPLTEDRKIREIELYLTTADYDPIRYEFGLMAAAEWRKLGFAVKTTPLEWSRLSQLCVTEHDYDANTLSIAGRSDRIDPDFVIYMLGHSSQTGKGQFGYNNYKSAEYDKYAEASRTEMDPAQRQKAVFKAQEIFSRDQPQTPILTRNQIMPYNSRDWDNVSYMMGEGLNSIWTFAGIKPVGSKKVLAWGYPSDITVLNPLVTTNNHDIQSLRLIYDRLMQIDLKGVPQPWAAEQVKTVDTTTVDVTIRPGMTFHDGKPVTAEDVKFSFDYPKETKAAPFMSVLEPIKEVTVTGERSVRFVLKQPFAPFFANCLATVFIIPKHIWQDVPEKVGLTKMQDFPNEKPVGSGMFKLDYRRRNEETKLLRHDNHFQKPAIEGILKIPYANVQGMVAGIQSGECDLGGWWIEQLQVEQLKKSAPHVKVIEVRDFGYYHINYNTARKPFDDVALRRALAFAIPKELILDRLLEGHGEIVHSQVAPSNEFWHNPNTEKIMYDLNKSRQLLKDAGYEWGADGRIYFPEGKIN